MRRPIAALVIVAVATACSSLLPPIPTAGTHPAPVATTASTTTTTEGETIINDSVLVKDQNIEYSDTAEPFWCGVDKSVTLSVTYQKGVEQRTETVVYNLADAVGSGWLDKDPAGSLVLPHPVGYVLRPDGFVQCFWRNAS